MAIRDHDVLEAVCLEPLLAADPDRDRSPLADVAEDRKPSYGLGRWCRTPIEYTRSKAASFCDAAQWWAEEVPLDDVHRSEIPALLRGDFHGEAGIECDHLPSPVLGGEVCMAPGAAAGAEGALAGEGRRRLRVDPIEDNGAA